MASENFENYLKGIYAIESEHGKVSTTLLSEYLRISAASVTEMIKKLADDGLITHEPYRGVRLTEIGRKQALRIVRRHRLWELFLVEILNYQWDEIHDEAERLEHVTSEGMEQRLDKALGYPKIDPHGDPIPDVNGELEGTSCAALEEFHPGDTVRVIRVSDDDPDVLQHASELGLELNKKISVKKKLKFDGSMVVKVGAKERFISQHVASAIFVEAL